MRLSEAILLGRHLVTPTAGSFCETANNGGCALTMGVKAVNGKGIPNHLWGSADSIWPWLNGACGCGRCSGTYMFHIALLFDCDVMTGKMTLEQLVDYVRSIEPAEPEQSAAEFHQEQPDWTFEDEIQLANLTRRMPTDQE